MRISLVFWGLLYSDVYMKNDVFPRELSGRRHLRTASKLSRFLYLIELNLFSTKNRCSEAKGDR